MSMSKTKNAEIANCLPLSGLLHTFADYLRSFSFFLHAVCLRFGAFGDQLTTTFAIRWKKGCSISLLWAGRWDPWMVGRVSRNNIFCVCAHVSKSCNTCWHLIHGIEFVEQPLGLQFFGGVFSRFFFVFSSQFFPVLWPRLLDLAFAWFWSLDFSLDWNLQHVGAWIFHAYGIWNMLIYGWFKG